MLGGTLDVTGVTTLTGDLISNGGDITNATAANANNIFATSTGKTTLGGGAVDLGASGSATTVKGTLNIDEAVTLDTTLDVTSDTSVSTFDSSGETSLATSGGVVNIASTGVMTTVKGTLNIDEAVTLDTTLDVTGDTNLNSTTTSTSSTTGALIVDGGVGIAENLNVGGAIDVTDAATTRNNLGIISGIYSRVGSTISSLTVSLLKSNCQ